VNYDFRTIEQKWQLFWAKHQTFGTIEDEQKEKFYVLDMFPYPSGAGLHVGHPLGYIASDVYARYKRLQGYNVLHPMGYDSFGLPAEQYAIQTGQHPEKTTTENIQRYRTQLDKLGFSYDWKREIRTSSPDYYKWTQWIFIQLFASWYDKKTESAQSIAQLIAEFEINGNRYVVAETDQEDIFTDSEWGNFSDQEKEQVLHHYRLAYLADTWVNWCPALGTVLANDEIINGRSERGGHPVEQRRMKQWTLRIKAYADRLVQGLDQLEWTDALKEMQRNWIGKSLGSSVYFQIKENTESIQVFTTRPDTIFGVSFIVLAPEHPLVDQITTDEFKAEVERYKKSVSLKTERDRQANVKNISGQKTGARAIHPFTGEELEIWIADYVLATYGTGAIMAVPAGDQRDWEFAQHFKLEIKHIFQDKNTEIQAYSEKDAILCNSGFLNDLDHQTASENILVQIEKKQVGRKKINFRLRNAVFARQRYWGEPFPVYYQNEIPKTIPQEYLPLILPKIENYHPTDQGQPPLANAKEWAWDSEKNKVVETDKINNQTVFPLELNTMPGWAGSSWYFMRYTDPTNNQLFAAPEKLIYWKNVDLYIGGAEHATGHLLYARFWTKFFFDKKYIDYQEPFQKLINQGMILGKSSFVYRNEQGIYVSRGKLKGTETPIHVDVSFVHNDRLDIVKFKEWRKDYKDAQFIFEDDGTYLCGSEIEKMSKSKFNVQTPDELIEKFGADTLRCYELFLGPIEQAKPWDTKGINGVANFLRKLWNLFQINENKKAQLESGEPTKENLKTLHKTIKRLEEDMNRLSFNTCISNFMICVNELSEQKCCNRKILEQLLILISPFAPHITEELWSVLGHEPGTISSASLPPFEEKYLVEESFDYPISFNGKVRFKTTLDLSLTPKEVEQHVLLLPEVQKNVGDKQVKKVIVVPGKIVNIVVG